MKIHTDISQIDQQQWKELLDNTPTASFFQTPECYYFYASLSFLEPFIFGVSENEKLVGIICGYIVSDGNFAKKFFSRRAIISGGPLLDISIEKDSLKQLLVATRQNLEKKSIYIEFRNYNDYSTYTETFEDAGFKYSPHLNFHLNSENIEIATKNLSVSKRRDIKLTKKEDAYWEEAKDMNDVKSFYELLNNLYLSKVKTPLFPFEFFEKIFRISLAKILVVRYKHEIIGGGLFVIMPNKTIYEWFVCGKDKKYKNVYPSVLGTWAGIEYAATNEIPVFDFMGAGKPDEEYGVRDFKSKFGGELVQHGRFLHINKKFLFELGKFAIKLYRSTNTKPTKPLAKSNYKIETSIVKNEYSAWEAFVKNHPNGNIFQTPQMFEVYRRTPKLEPKIIIARNANGVIVGCLLAFLQKDFHGILGCFTARTIVNGGPLAENNNLEIIDLLISQLDKLVADSSIFSQFRNLFDMQIYRKVFEKNNYQYDEHLDILLDLTKSKEELESLLHKERRRNIAHANKEGLIFKHLTDCNEIDEVVKLIKKTYSRVKVPMSYEKLFRNAKEVLHDEINVFGTYYEGKMIAGQIRLCYKDLVFAWYSGSDSDYFDKRPNDFLQWNVICWSKEHKYSVFDFGGAGKPNIPYGVRDYKLKFGGEIVSYGRFEKTHKPLLMKLGKKLYSIYNNL